MTTRQRDGIQPDTVAAKAYRLLRDDIMNGVYPPGTHLAKRVLAKKYGVSVPPIIEACLRLENDGLVENSPLLGTYVMDVFPEKIDDELILREAIECQVARVFAVRASDKDKANILALAKHIDDLQGLIKPDDRESDRGFQGQHAEFHIHLARLSGASLLLQQMERLWFRRFLLIWNIDKFTFPNPPNWHQLLVQALSAGDPDSAERAMRAHLTLNIDKKMTDSALRESYQKRKLPLGELLKPGDEQSV